VTATVEDPIAIALLVATAIETAGGAYFVGGSVASSLHGDPRSTNDIDFVISLPVERVGALAVALGADFELDRDVLRDALLRKGCANGFYLPVLTKIDLFALGTEPYDQIEFARRRPVPVGPAGEALIVKSPEDSVLRKLLWYRAGGEVSDKQWRDIVSILCVSRPEMDPAYLSDWARRLDCEDLLARAEKDAAASR
jgi:hypothetical protein